MPLATGTVLKGRYRIDSLLGQGGFGAVYRAFDISLDKTVALKENLDITEDARRQFITEARVLARLSHPNLPRVTDHFVLTGKGQYLVMDFVEGEDLETLISRVGTISEKQANLWISQVADALNYLHNQHPPIIHRDIKPANIRITPQDKAVLVDFGLVKLYKPTVKTTMGARAVTPGYSPPEQYGQGRTNVQTDVYALGATLYTMLTGEQPMESVHRLTGAALSTARELNSKVSSATSQVVERAMHVTPTQRFQTVEDFRDALIGKTLPASSLPGRSDTAPVGRSMARWLMIGIPVIGLLAVLVVLGGVMGLSRSGVISLPLGVGQTPIATASLTPTTAPSRTPTPTPTADAAATAAKEATITQNALGRMVLTPTAGAQQTQSARATGTATVQAPFLATARADIRSGELILGPQDGALPHRLTTVLGERDEVLQTSVTDFVVEAVFTNPYDPQQVGHPWDYGFYFRQSLSNEYVLVVSSSGRFAFLFSSLNSGAQIDELDRRSLVGFLEFEVGAQNKLGLHVRGEKALLFVNDQFVAELDLPAAALNSAGGLGVVTGYIQGDLAPGRETTYSDLMVYELR